MLCKHSGEHNLLVLLNCYPNTQTSKKNYQNNKTESVWGKKTNYIVFITQHLTMYSCLSVCQAVYLSIYLKIIHYQLFLNSIFSHMIIFFGMSMATDPGLSYFATRGTTVTPFQHMVRYCKRLSLETKKTFVFQACIQMDSMNSFAINLYFLKKIIAYS